MKAVRLLVIPRGDKVWRAVDDTMEALEAFGGVRIYPARREGPSIVTRMMLARRANSR